MPFVKLDCDILKSSLWPDKGPRDVFITALLMAEPFEVQMPAQQIEIRTLKPTGWMVPMGWYGFVKGASASIIHLAMVGREEGLAALEILGAPDYGSKSRDFDGRRLVRIEGGFIVLNFVKYRERDYTSADRSKRWRERQKKQQREAERESRVAKRRANGKTIRPEHRTDGGRVNGHSESEVEL